ncbi:MAG: hypothetical protein KDD36_11990 [Flavobacteriales bacterium]|nr:hypothetical protein [Flavobacteriales bacterium]
MIKFIAVLVLIELVGCGLKAKFTEAERACLPNFKEGQVLVFKNTLGDTIIYQITSVHNYFPKYNPIELHGMYRPEVYHASIKLLSPIESDFFEKDMTLFHAVKNNRDEPAQMTVHLNFGAYELPQVCNTQHELPLQPDSSHKKNENLILKNIYDWDLNRRQDEAKMIYWDQVHGIVKYECFNGSVWERVWQD